jgi:Zn-finger nucleic acid-binding protein
MSDRRLGTGRACSCSLCGGAWVPFAGMEVVMPRLAELAPAEKPGEPAGAPPAGRLKCPECGGDMVGVKGGEARVSSLRTCLVCFGRWVDGGELFKLRRRGLLGRLADLFRSGKRPPAAGEPARDQTVPQPSAEESARTGAPPEDEPRE